MWPRVLCTGGVSKWVWNAEGAHRFDLSQDPGEDTPASMDQAGAAARTAWESEITAGPELPLVVTLPQKTQDDLKALGYAE